MALTTIKIKKNDGFPEHICKKCSQRLKSAFEFKQQCENSDCWLRNSKDTYFIYDIETKNEDLYNEEENEDDNIGFDDFTDVKDELEISKADGKPYYVEVEPDIANLENPLLDIDPISEAISTPKKVKARRKMKKKIEVAEDSSDSDDIPVKALIDKSDRTDGDSDSQMFNGVKAYTCSHCKDVFTSLYQFQVHKTTHPCKFECVVCNQKFLTAGGLESHLKAYKNNCANTECNVCHKKYKTYKLLLKHKRVHEGKSKMECTYCKKEFSHSGNLKRHLMIHENDRPFVCHHCGMSFNQATGLKQHMFYKHTTERPHLCNICGHRSKDKRALSKHVAVRHLDITDKSHSIELPFACSYCPKRFSQRAGLKHHTYVHTRERPYSCKVCNKRFSQKSHVKVHMLTHSVEKKHICDVCKHAFALKGNLKAHMRTHTGETPFVCTMCGKGFYVANKLRQHVLKIERNDGFPDKMCSKCSKRLKNAFDFKQQCEKSDVWLRMKKEENSFVSFEYTNVKEDLPHRECKSKKANHINFVEIKEENDYAECEILKEEIDHLEVKPDIDAYTGDTFSDGCDTDSINKDTEIVRKPKNYNCKICKLTFMTKHSLQVHRMTHPSKFKCPDCSLSFKTAAGLESHLKAYKNKCSNTECDVCKKVYPNIRLLLRHKRIHTLSKTTCSICNKEFAHLGNLTRHMMIHEGEKPFVCHHCGMRFNQSSTLNSHVMYKHTTERPHLCNICGRGFKNSKVLDSHMAVIHLKVSKSSDKRVQLNKDDKLPDYVRQTHSCNVCSKVLSSKTTLRHHLRLHSANQVRPFPCMWDKCGKTFKDKHQLRVHERTHTGEQPYSCKICGRAFSQGTHLKEHTLTHSGEKKHKCEVCNHAFALKGNLKAHMMTHTGETPFVCDICGKGFYVASKLKHHVSKGH